MNAKLKSLLQQLLQSPRRFPVELALGVVFFIIAVWDSETREWSEKTAEYVSAVNGDILWFFVPLMALTFWLHRVNRGPDLLAPSSQPLGLLRLVLPLPATDGAQP